MKRRKPKYVNKKKSKKSYKCDACGSIISTLLDYQKHVNHNIGCKRKLPYSCQFCSYVGYELHGFHKHLQYRPSCDQFYKEKEVTTGQILDFSLGKVRKIASKPNETSYQYKRFSAAGMEDTVQLNLTNPPITDMEYRTKWIA